MRLLVWPLVWLALLGLGEAAAQDVAPPRRSPPASLTELEQSIQAILEATGTAGASVAVVSSGRVEWSAALGTADRASGLAVDRATLFRVGSVAKTFIALAVLRLVEEGRLGLDDRLADLAPELTFRNAWEQTDPVRLVHLLEHTAGFNDMGLREFGMDAPGISLREGLELTTRARVSRWPPGRHFAYSNVGAATAAYIVEKVAGEPYEAYVRRALFEPLGMTAATFEPPTDPQRRLATGYWSDGVAPVPYAHTILRPAGSLNATAEELASLVRLLLNGGTADGIVLLSPASIERLQTPGSTLAAHHGIRAGYGLGSFTLPERGFLFHGHDGGIDGFAAAYGYLPAAGRGYVYLLNSQSYEAFEEVGGVLRSYITRDLRGAVPPPVAVPADRLLGWSGYYEAFTPRLELARFIERLIGVVRVRPSGSRLFVTPVLGPRHALVPLGESRFRGERDPVATVAFLQDDDGRAIIQAFSDGFGGNFRRVAAGSVWLRWTAASAVLLLMLSAPVLALPLVSRILGRRRMPAAGIAARLLPLLAVLCLAAALALAAFAGELLPLRFGRFTPWSAGFTLLTIGFAAATMLGLAQVLRSPTASLGQRSWAHALLVSLANLTALLYLGYHGLIGIRFWS